MFAPPSLYHFERWNWKAAVSYLSRDIREGSPKVGHCQTRIWSLNFLNQFCYDFFLNLIFVLTKKRIPKLATIPYQTPNSAVNIYRFHKTPTPPSKLVRWNYPFGQEQQTRPTFGGTCLRTNDWWCAAVATRFTKGLPGVEWNGVKKNREPEWDYTAIKHS